MRRRHTFARLWSLPTGRFGLIVVASVVGTAILARFWLPFDPQAADVNARWLPPSWPHVFGTDGAGRDILSLVMAGAGITIAVSVGSAVIATALGIALAALGALTRRGVRESVAVFIDILVAFPVLIIAMMIAAVWGGSLWVVIWAVGIGFGVTIARVTRPELRRVLHSDFVLAGTAAGLSRTQNLWRHLLPNVAPVFVVQLSWAMAVAVLAEAGLSYLGLGAPLTEPSWGVLLRDLQQYLMVYPLAVLAPGLAITITVLGLNLLGDGVRDAFDPTLGRNTRGAARRARTHVPEVIS